MKRYEFIELCDKYHKVEEAIYLYDSGRHPEYNKEILDETLDDVHKELCYQVSLLAQKLIRAIDNGETINPEEKDFLNSLYIFCDNCRCFCDCPDMFDLTHEYGNGLIDSIGADFEVLENNTPYKFFGYREFYELLENYNLAD